MKAVDLFAGCGGLSLGFMKAGVKVKAAFDWWDPAIAVYAENIKQHPIHKKDLSDIEGSVQAIAKYKPEIIFGGPPCQDFSHAGKRSEGERADLTIAFAEIIKQIKPQWFVMENVDRAQKSKAFIEAMEIFKQAGYGLTTVVLDASFCGVPQKRKRFFCIGRQSAQDSFLLPIINKKLSAKPMTMRDYFGNDLCLEHYYRHPRNYSRRAIFSIDEPAPTVRGVNRPVPSGYEKHPGDPVDPKTIRPLTTEERAQVQTFPKDFKWLGTKTDKEQMIGNAVPVGLAEFVGSCILEYEKDLKCEGKRQNRRRTVQSLAENCC